MNIMEYRELKAQMDKEQQQSTPQKGGQAGAQAQQTPTTTNERDNLQTDKADPLHNR